MQVGGTTVYRMGERRSSPQGSRRGRKALLIVAAVLFVAAGVFGAYKLLTSPSGILKNTVNALQVDSSVADAEKQIIQNAIEAQQKTHKGAVTVRAEATLAATDTANVLAAYVPVTNVYAARQQITKAELAGTDVFVVAGLDATVRSSIATILGVSADKLIDLTTPLKDVPDTAVVFVPASQISSDIKLLAFEGAYYLDSFDKGAVFRQAVFSGVGAIGLNGLKLNDFASKDTTLKVNMSGVTALTRVMISKLNSVKNGAYFSEKIGAFLADADITHVSNEVSFKAGCTYHASSFCAPPLMIETLKASGVDLVEITGNHNNDVGNQFNTETINLYHSLGWKTIGGGLNTTEAAKPYIADLKGSKVAFLAYNKADGLGSGAIATSSTAGANYYDAAKAEADIAAAKQQADFVVVNIQYSECQAYPNGFVEFPQCDGPISGQTALFRQVVDFGADMVVGSSAHQPQTYESYKGGAIYYGLGNMYFEQTQWPGTERGIILTHYFVAGKLVQTKLSPTVYDKALQTQLMNNEDALYLLERLKTARP